ncbi:MAG TPA: FMN-binding protein [Candidatus Rifleibacterium sp.]|nr:FMN-binding protein [Candidatus Rifleibacterium sp.]HPT44599.1 FMN-binding protein [Candidatus Rifleibacterium sp.]
MNDKIKTVLFTVVVTAIFVSMVSGVNALLIDRITANRTIARQKVILNLFGLTVPASEQQIPAQFAAGITRVSFPARPDAECYKLTQASDGLFVVAFTGQGFWDNISGFIALDLKNRLVKGLEFTQHGETPGLGGRISEPEFKARFNGKPFTTLRPDGRWLKLVAEKTASKPDEVDGITGATGTSNAIEKIVNHTISNFLTLNEGGTHP